MSLLLARIARTLSHYRWRSLAVALLTVIVLGAIAGTSGKSADDFSIPGTETQQAIDLFKEHYPAQAGADATLVLATDTGTLSDPPRRERIESTLAEIKKLVGEGGEVSDPFVTPDALSEDGTVAQVAIRYVQDPTKIQAEDGEKLEAAAHAAEGEGISVAMRGTVVDVATEQEFPIGELIGVALAIVLLTILFRSGAAMLATIVGALIGVMVGQILLTALAKPLGLPDFASVIALMLGLGAGIDYALLIIGRYREQTAAGDSVRDAAGKAAATAGSAVVAAGLIVMVAIAGLLVIGIPMIGKMGIGAAIGIAAVVVSAIAVLPIMIGLLRRWLTPRKAKHVAASPVFARWGELVTRRPWFSILAGVLILLLFAVPLTQMRLGQPDDGNQPMSKTQRKAYDTVAKAFGPGANGPFMIAVEIPEADVPVMAEVSKSAIAAGAAAQASVQAAKVAKDDPSAKNEAAAAEAAEAAEAAATEIKRVADRAPETTQALAAVRQAINDDDGIKSASEAFFPTPDGGAAILEAIPTTAPQDAKTSDTLSRLRGDAIPGATAGTPIADHVFVGGNTAGFEDFSAKVADRLPVFIALVIGLSVLLLMMAFRSFWIPLVSAVFNLLSVGAAYGVVVAVFQEGFGASLLGVDSGVPIVSFIPVMIFAILFGLSMDYNVFLLSRIHEAYNEGDGPRESVIHGVSRIGKVILFAGLIMASVFLAFVSQPDVIAKMMGLGLGLAILIDVLVVRLLIAPAVVTLLGDKAWWLPGWLDRLLPNVSLEGHLVENLDERGPALVDDDLTPTAGTA